MLYRLLEIPAVYTLTQVLNPFTTAAYRRLLRALAPAAADALLLDLGCGLGTYKDQVSCRYLGADHNPRYLARAARLRGPRFTACDAASLPFADACLDAVLVMATLHHLSDAQVLETLVEARRVLRPGGAVLVVEPVLPRPWWFWKWAFFKLDRGRFARREGELLELLGRCGQVRAMPLSRGLLHDVLGARVPRE